MKVYDCLHCGQKNVKTGLEQTGFRYHISSYTYVFNNTTKKEVEFNCGEVELNILETFKSLMGNKD